MESESLVPSPARNPRHAAGSSSGSMGCRPNVCLCMMVDCSGWWLRLEALQRRRRTSCVPRQQRCERPRSPQEPGRGGGTQSGGGFLAVAAARRQKRDPAAIRATHHPASQCTTRATTACCGSAWRCAIGPSWWTCSISLLPARCPLRPLGGCARINNIYSKYLQNLDSEHVHTWAHTNARATDFAQWMNVGFADMLPDCM